MDLQQKFKFKIPVEELVARYSRLYGGAIYDALDHMGLPH